MTENEKLQKQKMLDDYKQSLKDKSAEELKKIEEDLIKEMDDIDKDVANIEFKMPDVDNYKDVAENIQKLLAKQTISWEYTLGQMTLFNFWDPNEKPEKINYPTLDATLRQLGGLQFTGPDEWNAVIIINNFFKELHPLYIDTTERIYDAAAKHNILQNEMELKTPIPKKIQLDKE